MYLQKTLIPTILLLISNFNFNTSIANTQSTTEPPVPIYYIHQDNNLKAAYNDSLKVQKQALSDANKQIDSLQSLIQKSMNEKSALYTWLYILIISLSIAIIVLLVLNYRTKKDLLKIKRGEKR